MAKTGLIVDDATFMRMRLKDILGSEFQVVAEAEDGDMAVALYRQYRPDFVTLDITMPRTDGLEALGRILDADPQARVIIVSAVGQRQMVFRALSRGAKDFVIKPFDPARVVGAVRRLFREESP